MFTLQRKKRILKGMLFSSIIVLAITSVFVALKKINIDTNVDAASGSHIVTLRRDFRDGYPKLVDGVMQYDDKGIAYSVPNRSYAAVKFFVVNGASRPNLLAVCVDSNFAGPDVKMVNGEKQMTEFKELAAALATKDDIITNENNVVTNANYKIDGYTTIERLNALKLVVFYLQERIDSEDIDSLLGLTDAFYERYDTATYNNATTDPYGLLQGNNRKPNVRFAFGHAVAAALLHGNAESVELLPEDKSIVINAAKRFLDKVKNVNDPDWALASGYGLYHLDLAKFAEENLDNSDYKSTLIATTEHPDAPWKNSYKNQDMFWVEPPTYGSIMITGCDAETGGCASMGSSTMVATTFLVINRTGHSIVHNGRIIENNSLVESKRITENDVCELPRVENLPYGTYEIMQSQAGLGHVRTTEKRTVAITSDTKETILVKFCNEVIRGDVKFKKVDQNGKPMSNVAFKITSKTTNESHIVVTNNEGVVDTSAIAHTSNTNAYDTITSNSYTYHNDYGTWFGKKPDGNMVPANNDMGALPYDSYSIEELQCESNGNCYEDSMGVQKDFDFTIIVNNRLVEFNESWENVCVDFSLITQAADNKDGDKYILASKDAEIRDTITYNLKKDQEYIIKGILMDKETGKAVEIDGKTIENSVKVESDKEKNQVTMVFKIPDATSLGGKEIVVFESLYEGDDLIESHDDINDIDQTVLFVNLDTTAKDKLDNNQSIQPEKDVTIVDSVDYCLLKDQDYILEGTLMDKGTGEALLIDGKTVVKTMELKTVKSCDKVEMEFVIDATKLGGTDIVVFERVYLKNKDNEKGNLVVEHADIEDDAQLIKVLQPEIPDTGFITSSDQRSESNNPVAIITIASTIIAVISTVGLRISSRKKILR